MNWNPLRKITASVPSQRPELDSSTQNANEILERLVAEFDSAENVTKNLYQTAKKLPDHILCTGKFETKLTDDLARANLFATDVQTRSILDDWNAYASVSNSIGDEYVITLQRTLLDPLKQLKKHFAESRAAIRLHDALQLDVIRHQRKVAWLNDKDKTGVNLVKLQESKKALANSQREFARHTQLLVNDLTKFLAGSNEMLQPLLEGFIAAEVSWVQACKRCMDSKTQLTETMAFEDTHNSDGRMRDMEEAFKSLSALSICSETK